MAPILPRYTHIPFLKTGSYIITGKGNLKLLIHGLSRSKLKEKPPAARTRTNNKLNQQMAYSPGKSIFYKYF